MQENGIDPRDMGGVKTEVLKTLNWVKSQLSSFLTRSTADGLYLGKTAKASSAVVADSANSVQWGNVQGKPNIGGSWSASNAQRGYARDPSTGFTIAWNVGSSFDVSRTNYATPRDINTQTISFARSFSTILGCSVVYHRNSGTIPVALTPLCTFNGNSVTVNTVSEQDSNGTNSFTPYVTVFGFS